ncbi:MAG: hypothetical protein R3C59_16855 [Planctomycetaceae bacterium]
MSETEDCIERLSKLYQNGTRSIPYSELFPNSNLSHNQKASIIQTLEDKKIIKTVSAPSYVYRKDQVSTPDKIQILSGVLDAKTTITNKYSYDWWIKKYKPNPVIGTFLIIVLVVTFFISMFHSWFG